MGQTLAALGFTARPAGFVLRTALAAWIALLTAWLIGLEHPQWSAMTVWAASQPLRGQLVERSFFRLSGTLVGTAAGVVLVLLFGLDPPALVTGLALWVGTCVGIGNLQRSHLSYGTMLAGISAAMIALLDTGRPDRVFSLGSDRMLTVLVGVLVALAIGLLLAPSQSPADLNERIRSLSARVLRAMALRLRGEGGDRSTEFRDILSEMAAIEEELDPHASGSLRSRRAAKAIRQLLFAQAEALVWLRGSGAAASEPAISRALDQASRAIAGKADAAEILSLMDAAAESGRRYPAMRQVLLNLASAMQQQFGMPAREAGVPSFRHPVILHRDWRGARQAAIRAAATILILGGTWLLTGWSYGPYMMLGATVMLSVFSTFENPARTVWFVFLGQVGGAIAAIACRWLAWPLAADEVGMIALTLPFILVGAPLMAHRRTAPGAIDYNMALLLMLQPVYPPTGTFTYWLGLASAVVSGPLAGLVAYRLIFPLDAGRRMNMLIAAMIRDLQAMAVHPEVANRRVWRARLTHRMLRLIRWAEKVGDRKPSVVDGSLAVVTVGEALIRLRRIMQAPDASRDLVRCADVALRRASRISHDPVRAQHALRRCARRLARRGRPEAEIVRDAAEALADTLPFFLRRDQAPRAPAGR